MGPEPSPASVVVMTLDSTQVDDVGSRICICLELISFFVHHFVFYVQNVSITNVISKLKL